METLVKYLDEQYVTYSINKNGNGNDIEIPYFLDDVPTEEQWRIMYLIGKLKLTYKYHLDDDNTLIIYK